MKKNVHPMISYTVIIIGGAFLALTIFVIAKVGTPDISWNQNTPSHHANNQPLNLYQITDSQTFAATALNFTGTFSDSGLREQTAADDNHFTFNQIISNSGNRIAYAELSNCAGFAKQYYGKDMPSCDWDYSIRIKDRTKETTQTIYTDHGDAGNLERVALIYFPIAWTKNDKQIILGWANIGNGGNEGAPTQYLSIGVNGGKIEEIGSGIFFEDFSKEIYTTTSEKTYACELGGNNGKIVLRNIETGDTKTLLEEKNSDYSIMAYDKIKGVLTYIHETVPAGHCSAPEAQSEEKQIKL